MDGGYPRIARRPVRRLAAEERSPREPRPPGRRRRPRRRRGHPDEVGDPEGPAPDRRPHPASPTRSPRRPPCEPDHLVVVVGHGRDQVTSHLAEVAPNATAVVQDQQRGTGHAVAVRARGAARARRHRRRDLRRRPAAHRRDAASRCSTPTPTQGNAVTVLTAAVADPTGYGRIVRDDRPASSSDRRAEGRDRRAARDHRDQLGRLRLRRRRRCATRSARLDTDNAQGEVYLTDVRRHRRGRRRRVGALAVVDDAGQIEGVNDRVQLAGAAPGAQPAHRRALDARRASPSSTRPPPGSTPT